MFGFSFPSVFGLKAMAITGAVMFSVGAFAGWQVCDAFNDAAEGKRKVAELKRQITARDAAAEALNEMVRRASQAQRQAERKADALEAQISAGDCWPDDDAGRVRDLWK